MSEGEHPPYASDPDQGVITPYRPLSEAQQEAGEPTSYDLGWREGFRKGSTEPHLGMATTAELIAELHARATVSATIGEAWPKYRTVNGPLVSGVGQSKSTETEPEP